MNLTVSAAYTEGPASVVRLDSTRSGAGLDRPRAVAAAIRSRRRRGLILDLDDTLYPRQRFMLSGFAAVAAAVHQTYGIDADAAYGLMARTFASDRCGRELQVLCTRFGIDAAAIPRLVDAFRRHTPTIQLTHGVPAMLEGLRMHGWRIAVLTNGLPLVQFRKVAALGLMPMVDEVVYAEEHVVGGKPAAEAFRAALRVLDLAAAECVCVGDDLLRDVEGARAVGIRTVRLRREEATAPAGLDAEVVIDSILDLPGVATMMLDPVTADVA